MPAALVASKTRRMFPSFSLIAEISPETSSGVRYWKTPAATAMIGPFPSMRSIHEWSLTSLPMSLSFSDVPRTSSRMAMTSGKSIWKNVESQSERRLLIVSRPTPRLMMRHPVLSEQNLLAIATMHLKRHTDAMMPYSDAPSAALLTSAMSLSPRDASSRK
ncbi:MAG: hypothetical protein Q4Q58_03105 [Thermoplasmata archaeon]|nr:hypothetical protein [Thermoplasmata archaeon]